MNEPKIYIAFRFHVNFYHSYRGDTPDEKGFGKDIRVIRSIIETLNRFNDNGVDVCGTWDCDNFFSLQTMIPEHCPDVLEQWKRRVAAGKDEIQIVSYNNGLISAHTAKEFEDSIRRAISNGEQSGITDIFGGFKPIVRPHEMMFTPSHLMAYPHCGISAISLYYSALPLNAFSNFVQPLSLIEQFNPLELKYEGMPGTMTLIPTYNPGDVIENISLFKWVSKLRKQQLELAEPVDLMLVLDMDASSEFWFGLNYPVLKRFYSTLNGLSGLIESLQKLDFIAYSTPGNYLATHPTVGSITIRQDTADGSFDGLSSWAEKWSNQKLWTGIERARVLELQSRRMMEIVENKSILEDVESLLSVSYEDRLRSLSTAHFGLSSPIVKTSRLQTAQKLVKSSVDTAAKAFGVLEIVLNESKMADSFSVIDYARGIDTSLIKYPVAASRSLVKLRLLNSALEHAESITLVDEANQPCPFSIVTGFNELGEKRAQLYFKVELASKQEKTYKLLKVAEEPSKPKPTPMRDAGPHLLENSELTCRFDESSNLTGLILRGQEFLAERGFNTAITYANNRTDAESWKEVECRQIGTGHLKIRRMRTELLLKGAGGKKVDVKRQFRLIPELPYLYVDMTLTYPITSFKKYKISKAEKLDKEWDGNWIEITPCEIIPQFFGTKQQHLKIWKHNYFGHATCYELNYGDFSKNQELDAFNNHITFGWVAVTDGKHGLLIAQTAENTSSFAFCPMRTRKTEQGECIHLNPFGSYYGKQFKYQTAVSGLGKLAAFLSSNHLDPLAPSYNGKVQSFSLMIAPYEGDQPPRAIQNDAMAFAYPYLILTKSDMIKDPECRSWKQWDLDH